MTRSWLFPTLTACIVHGAMTVLPVQFGDTEVEAQKPEITFRLVSPPEVPPPPVVEEPPPTKPPPPPRRQRRTRPAPAPVPPDPQPEEESHEEPETQEPEQDTSTQPRLAAIEPAPTIPAELSRSRAPRIDLRAYGRRVHQSVIQHRRYPRVARRLGLEGHVLVKISVNRQGRLAGTPTIHRSSGHELLDQEALRMVRAAAPFSPLPVGFTKRAALIVIPVRFELRQ